MPRRQRLYVPGMPCHVIQRGNNRTACFFGHGDYTIYLAWLSEACLRYGCAIHSYVMMTNHVHLLLTPARQDSISRVMQSLGRRYVQRINLRLGRTGTLWEGRHKSSLVQSERYLLVCARYIELNPVRAGMVDSPGAYPWSSYRQNALGADGPLVQPHSVYEALGRDPTTRQAAYRELFDERSDPEEILQIRNSINRGEPLATPQFKERLGLDSGTPFVGRLRLPTPTPVIAPVIGRR